jgi:protoporphyrinogen oxidase
MKKTQDRKDVLILGGGLSGLSLACFLGGNGTVLEAEARPGGLCRSFRKDGFVYDIGGHILFSKDRRLLRLIVGWLQKNVRRGRRRNEIRYGGRFIKYPFENGLAGLPPEEIYECLIGYLDRTGGPARNLQEWFVGRFGRGIADKYLLPYNRKIWKRDLRNLSTLWVERVPDPSREEIVKSAVGVETEGYLHQLDFYYPRRGGIEALIAALRRKVPKLLTGFRAAKIVRRGGDWEVSDGSRSVSADTLVSTIPPRDLLAALEGVPPRVTAAARRLQYNSVILVMLGVKHEGLSGRTAVYIPDPKILPHRVCFMKSFSPLNAPAGRSHALAEIAVPPSSPLLREDLDGIAERVFHGIKDICGISERDLVCTEVRVVPYAYVVYDRDYARNTKIVYGYLSSRGIRSLGRFGSFQYLNMDACVAHARALAEDL